MNDGAKYELEQLRKAIDRLAGALDKKELHPDAARAAETHLREMSTFVTNFGTGLRSTKNIEDFLADNPPPPRSPDVRKYDEDDEQAS